MTAADVIKSHRAFRSLTWGLKKGRGGPLGRGRTVQGWSSSAADGIHAWTLSGDVPAPSKGNEASAIKSYEIHINNHFLAQRRRLISLIGSGTRTSRRVQSSGSHDVLCSDLMSWASSFKGTMLHVSWKRQEGIRVRTNPHGSRTNIHIHSFLSAHVMWHHDVITSLLLHQQYSEETVCNVKLCCMLHGHG